MNQSNHDYEMLKELRQVLACDIGFPLRTICGLSRILLEYDASSLSEDGKGCVKGIIGACERLRKNVQGLGEFLDIRVFPPQIEKCDVGSTARSACAELSEELDGLSVKLACDFPVVQADRRQLGEVFVQLLWNAVDRNDKDEKRVEISWLEHATDYEFVVTDNGMGIPAMHHETIVSLLDKLDRGVRSKQGQGTGLTICQCIVEEHGGKMWVDSTEGVGSSFHFTILKRGER